MTELCSICLAARHHRSAQGDRSADPDQSPLAEAHTACCPLRATLPAGSPTSAPPADGRFSPPILPTGLRLGASTRFRGRGVTMAFLDAGFYAHPDLITPVDRIREYVDVTRSDSKPAATSTSPPTRAGTA